MIRVKIIKLAKGHLFQIIIVIGWIISFISGIIGILLNYQILLTKGASLFQKIFQFIESIFPYFLLFLLWIILSYILIRFADFLEGSIGNRFKNLIKRLKRYLAEPAFYIEYAGIEKVRGENYLYHLKFLIQSIDDDDIMIESCRAQLEIHTGVGGSIYYVVHPTQNQIGQLASKSSIEIRFPIYFSIPNVSDKMADQVTQWLHDRYFSIDTNDCRFNIYTTLNCRKRSYTRTIVLHWERQNSRFSFKGMES
jgi:hypothetical protein